MKTLLFRIVKYIYINEICNFNTQWPHLIELEINKMKSLHFSNFFNQVCTKHIFHLKSTDNVVYNYISACFPMVVVRIYKCCCEIDF